MTKQQRRFAQPDPPVLLCVSDHQGYLNTVRRSMGRAGFTVVTSRSGSQALELVAGSTIDVMLIDYDMPQMDGISLFSQIKDQARDGTPPTLITGENYAPSLLSQCLTAGAAGLHVRSESPEVLVDRVISVIQNEAKRIYAEQIASRRQVEGGTDLVTGLASKNHFNRRLSGESVASYRDKNHISLLMVDLDRYDRIRESYGEDKAEDVLVQAARLIEGELRSRDCVARYDDHTFAVVLPATPLNAAEAVGKRLRRILSTTEFGSLDETVSITVSAGVTARPPGTLLSPEEMITQALRSNAAATSMGGNRVVADSTLTGKPLVLLAGAAAESIPISPPGIENVPVELRPAAEINDAKEKIQGLPVAMVIVEQNLGGDNSGLDLLEWIRDRFPSVRRVLLSDKVDTSLMELAVNKSGIDYFIRAPLDPERLSRIVDELLFS